MQVLLSNSDCSFVRGLYRGFPIHTMVASRAINCRGRGRGAVTEVLIAGWPRKEPEG